MADTMETDPMLVWLQMRRPPQFQTKPVPQSAFSDSSKASSSSSSSSSSSAFVDDPQSFLQSPRSTLPSQTYSPSSSFFEEASQSSASSPPQVHAATLRRLEGEDVPPSWFLRAPAERIPVLERCFGPWRASRMDLAHEVESRLSFRDRKLTADERRVARPREITQAQFRLGWLPVMRRLWAQRLATEKKREQQTTQMTQTMPKTQKPTPRPPRPTRGVSPVNPPPQFTHRYPLPQGKEETPRSCCRQQRKPSCPFCSQDSVTRAVLENQI